MRACVPKCLSTSLVVPIPKKGNPTDPDNYPGISLMETLLKVACTLVNKRLSRAVKGAILLHKEQTGFRDCGGYFPSLRYEQEAYDED